MLGALILVEDWAGHGGAGAGAGCEQGIPPCSMVITALSAVGSDPKLFKQKPWGSDPTLFWCPFKCVFPLPRAKMFASEWSSTDVRQPMWAVDSCQPQNSELSQMYCLCSWRSERSPGEGNGNTLQYSHLENSMDSGAWWATVHEVAMSWTIEQITLSFHFFMFLLCLICRESFSQSTDLIIWSLSFFQLMLCNTLINMWCWTVLASHK